MYSSRGNDGYGKQQPYSSQSSYTPQTLGGASLVGQGPQESEVAGYRTHGLAHGNPSAAAMAAPQLSHYGDLYSSVYGSTGKQISPMRMKGSASTGLEGRSNYASSIPDSPKFGVSEYVPSSRGYGQKVDQLYPDRLSEYSSIDRRQYPERNGAYMGRDLPSETSSRHADLVAFGHERQILNDAAVLRQEQMLKTHALQSGSVDGGVRQSDYLAARATVRQPVQDPIAYGGRVDSESRNLLSLTGLSYAGPHATSILGAAPQRSVEDLLYAQSSSNPGYGVSLPPGRNYGSGKGLHAPLLESDYSSGIMGHVSHLRVDDRNDDWTAYDRDLERRDKDRDYLCEREKDKEREKERLRERERERERERTREREKREKEREREREREKERDQREKGRDRDRKRGPELKHDLTPSKVARDHRSSSLSKDIKTLRRESPRREALHRLHSPVKEKRREYVCKVFAYKFVDVERDYLSLHKRYPRLYISPECSKVVVCWPKKNLQLPLYTPVSFEHDVQEDIKERKKSPSKDVGAEISKTGQQTTVWNAKIILMSGLSQNALAELSSERIYDDRIPHFCNMLRFAVLKKNSSLMAIGGPLDTVDGGDPSVDDSCLIQTALRYAKDVAHLDLMNCLHWNRFLEVHYHRVGKDGLFSHKEITVLYVPDLSECLPPLDLWRDQWLNHKKSIAEREHQQSLKKEISGKEEEVSKGKKSVHPKDGAEKTELQKKKGPSSAQSGDDGKKGKVANKVIGKGNIALKDEKDKSTEVEKDVVMKVQEEKSSAQTTSGAKKKKIVKRIVKRKVAVKKDSPESVAKKNDELDKEAAEGENVMDDADKQPDGPSATPAAVKTFARKRTVKQAGNSALENDEGTTPEIVSSKELENAENKAEVKSEETSTKILVKKKVIKRVLKKKAVMADTNSEIAKDGIQMGEKIIQAEQNNETVETNMIEMASTEEKIPDLKQQTEVREEQEKKDETENAVASDNVKPNSKEKEELKERNEAEGSVEKSNCRDKINKAEKEIKRINEPPRHPGLIVRTKACKDSKSLSLSLDSLLDYNDTDVEESTFELSLFAESLYEMLQYEMGSRLLDFLQKLRIKFVTKRKQGKRPREETSLKKREGASPSNRAKKDKKAVGDVKSSEVEKKKDDAKQDDNIVTVKEDVSAAEATMEDETSPKMIESETETKKIDDENEEEEEDPEEDEEMKEASPHHDMITEKHIEEGKKAASEEAVEAVAHNEAPNKILETVTNVESGNKDKSETKGTPSVIEKELLQAFRFFDRNRAGYVRVEDMRLVIHNLGKYLSHRDVKELVQSALLESSTGRDDRILYDKLVKMSDI